MVSKLSDLQLGPISKLLSRSELDDICARKSEPLGLKNLLNTSWAPPMPLLYWVGLQRAQFAFLEHFSLIGKPTYISTADILTYDGPADFVLVNRPWDDMLLAIGRDTSKLGHS